jgi:hypothetical protein
MKVAANRHEAALQEQLRLAREEGLPTTAAEFAGPPDWEACAAALRALGSNALADRVATLAD